MDDTQHFCLRWNNYQSSITSAFENLRDDEDFVDVTLACDGRSIKAHRVVLSACSPYFRELLKSTPCKHPVIVLQDVNFLDLHSLVEFIYHGEVNVHQKSLSSFLKTAEVLRVSGLTQQQAEETHSQLAQIQNLANTAGGRTPVNHLPSVHEDPLFPRNTCSPPPGPPGHISSQLFRRAAAAASLRRDRNNSTPSGVDECTMKRHRPDNGIIPSNNNSPDIRSTSPQLTPADFSTIKHNNNNTPPLKDEKRNGPTNNGISAIDKEHFTPSPRARSTDDVKSEPMELVCSNNNPVMDEHSNDSTGENDANRSSSGECGKGSLSSGNDDEIENSIVHTHQPPPFLMSPADSKLFPTPGSFNFSMAALTDPATLAGFNSQLQSAAEMAVSPQGGSTSLIGGVIVPGGNSNSSNNSHHHHHHPSHHHHQQQQQQQQQQQPPPPPHSQHHQHSAPHLHSHHMHHHQSHSSHHESSPQHQGVGSQQQQQQQMPSSSSGSVSSSGALQHLHHHSASPIDSLHHHPMQHHRRSLSPGGVGQGGLSGPSGSSITSAGSNRLLLPLPLTACHRCDVCGKLLSTKLTLKRHKEQQHLQPLNNAVCNLCHKVFRTLNSLNNHKSIYHRRQKNHHSSYFHSSSLHHSLTNSNNNGSGGSVVGNRGSSAAELLLSPITQQQHSPGGVVKPCMDFL
ncbi:broad-complex core protein isoform X1 [Eupeodes corollae]|uniref:broad-complex core protein isoform X1 n=1 Tax=Eupeodes corollae TaxID=290404 RepID=UPI002492E389|nr:broad-complex core protein isoform X1 [Eupeodes corollae]